MELKQCENGHFYSATEQVCPRCVAEGLIHAPGPGSDMNAGSYEKTVAVGDGAFNQTAGDNGVQDYGATESIYASSGSTFGGTFGGGFGGETGGTVAPDNKEWEQTIGVNRQPENGVEDYDVTEAAWPNGVKGFLPVVGWLVCIEGPSKGADYRIHAGYNYIGRDPHMDICLPNTDRTVSHNKHALIAFEPEECLFFFGPSEGKNIVKRNGKAVLSNTELEDRDILKIGSCQYLFVALCKDDFNWGK